MIIVSIKPASFRTHSFSVGNDPYIQHRLGNWAVTGRPHIWRPPTDVLETEDNVIIRVEIAGMHDGEITVSFDNHILIISGNRLETSEKRAYHQMEIPFGEFLTEVEVLIPIDIDRIDAEYRDGFLIVGLPKSSPKQIHIDQD